MSVWRATLGVDAKTVVEAVDYDEDAEGGVGPAPGGYRSGAAGAAGPAPPAMTGVRVAAGGGPWLGPTRCYLEADPVRVTCAERGVVAAQVPWTAHGARHTTVFEVLVAWLVVRMHKSAVQELLRVSWETVGAIVDRVVARDRAAFVDLARRIRKNEPGILNALLNRLSNGLVPGSSGGSR